MPDHGRLLANIAGSPDRRHGINPRLVAVTCKLLTFAVDETAHPHFNVTGGFALLNAEIVGQVAKTIEFRCGNRFPGIISTILDLLAFVEIWLQIVPVKCSLNDLG